MNNRDLTVTYYQRKTKDTFYIKLHKNLNGTVFYADTKEEIHPTLWTDEIENEFLRKKEKVHITEQPYFKLNYGSYLVSITLLGLTIMMAYFVYDSQQANASFKQDHKQQKVMRATMAKEPKIGQAFSMFLYSNNNEPSKNTYWAVIKEIGIDTMLVAVAKDPSSDLDTKMPAQGETKIIKIDTKLFKERFIYVKRLDGVQKFDGTTAMRVQL